MRISSRIAIVLIVALVNLGVWAWWNRPVQERSWAGAVNGVAYTPFHPDKSPSRGDRPTVEGIEKDIQTLESSVRSIRLYSSTDGSELVVPIARKSGIPVTIGAWLSKDTAKNEEEIAAAVRLARSNPNVRRIMIGNESIMRADQSVPDIIEAIKKVKRQVNVPVSTAEPPYVWMKHPELVAAVDFITVHLLPYWEFIPIDQALDYEMMRYNEVQARYPAKHVVIGEVGWPSEGPWRGGSQPSQVNQAKFLRDFFNVAAQKKLDYYVMEAFDQPWKREIEGAAGPSWGMWDADRHLKFPMVGEVAELKTWPRFWALSCALAFLPILYFLRRRGDDLRFGGRLFYAGLIQGVAAALVCSLIGSYVRGLSVSTEIAWGVLFIFQLTLLGVMLTDGMELTEVVWQRRFLRRLPPFTAKPAPDAPKVSIHVPCYNEPPEMVMETLDALSRLDYPNYEVLLLDNNTKDPGVWRPIEEYCRKLGSKFRFFHLDNWPGYKAGALNFGLEQTAADAQFVAVIDSDYQISPDWLKATIPHFQRPEVGFVQSPQDYRDWGRDLFQRITNWEYQGFFKIGMIQRNERNAIIQHGTMTIVRKSALKEVGRWGEWCITEDAELGLRLFEAGYEAVYMPESFGQGLVPDSFAAYKTQRFRWAYGAVQILKRHWREMLPSGRKLTSGQKFHFVAGWLPWFADAAHFVFGVAGIVWSIGMLILPKYFEFPPTAFMIPTLSAFVFKVGLCLWLYEARVRCSFLDKLGAALAGMALTHTVGRAIWQGLFTSGRPFVRTPKCENQPAAIQAILMAREEMILLGLLWLSALGIILVNTAANRDALMWATLLVVQSLPYLSAFLVSLINAVPELRARKSATENVPAPAAAIK